MWTALRTEISKICDQLEISKDRFKPVSMHEWKSIQEKIFQMFCYSYPNGFIWENLKGESYAIQFHYNYPFDQLMNLVDQDENVWLFLDETVSEHNKYWFYEGHIKDIVLILGETTQTDEVYIASKKYDWLLCVNHHDYIIAAGTKMIERLKQLEAN